MKLFIGEPGKISMTLSFYGGVSNNTFQKQTSKKQLTIYNHPLNALKIYSVACYKLQK